VPTWLDVTAAELTEKEKEICHQNANHVDVACDKLSADEFQPFL
jgi:hypothetical protein